MADESYRAGIPAVNTKSALEKEAQDTKGAPLALRQISQ